MRSVQYTVAVMSYTDMDMDMDMELKRSQGRSKVNIVYTRCIWLHQSEESTEQ